MKKNLTLKSKNIVQTFKKCTSNDEVNLQHANGSIYEVGGILSKLENDKWRIGKKNNRNCGPKRKWNSNT